MTFGNGTMFRNKTCFNDYENETGEFKECFMGCCPGKEIEILFHWYMCNYIILHAYIHR